MRCMCGLPKNVGEECFPKWFRYLFYKYLDKLGRAQVIAEEIELN